MSDPFSESQQKQEEEPDSHFEPVIKLTDQVQTKTHEENEDVVFKTRAKLFRFESATTEWKERGTGEVRLLAHRDSKKVRLVMRRDKTLKVCANHLITSDMKLQPNIGSDRSWVYRCAADISEGEPSSETLAIRFGTPEYAGQFKRAFESAQQTNAEIAAKSEDNTVTPAESAKTEGPIASEPQATEPAEEAKTVTETDTKTEEAETKVEDTSKPAGEQEKIEDAA